MKRKKFTSKSKSKKNSKQLRKYIKDKKKELGISKSRKFLLITCNVCKREFKVRVNNKKIYTPEILKNWVCLICKDTWQHRLWKKRDN